MIDFVVKILIAYLLGSLLGSLVVGKLSGGVDIRTQGSGNAGGTNALRTQGPWFAFWVMVIDIGKGWLAAYVLPALSLPMLESSYSTNGDWLAVACAAAVVVGHVYPIWFGFRGGKGAATLVGVVLGLKPIALLVILPVWLLSVMVFGFVGLATMLATLAFTIYQFVTHGTLPLTLFGAAMTAFVVYTHRSNIARMRVGNENRVRRLWLLRPR
ncbi:MAG: glycerol-3-phosphate 1-O-acyltransferase PlsY [Candidatus Obscuribacterales bacterium]|nr:glycerol-3-phosphate 1-O-acyltransferase PlsY [Steroidobacteraceae bacterium]